VDESQLDRQKKTDELVQLVTGVALIAFALVAIAVVLAARVADVLSRPY
jgi:succinate dehydrogenase hydrophobic anchor subunit